MYWGISLICLSRPSRMPASVEEFNKASCPSVYLSASVGPQVSNDSNESRPGPVGISSVTVCSPNSQRPLFQRSPAAYMPAASFSCTCFSAIDFATHVRAHLRARTCGRVSHSSSANCLTLSWRFDCLQHSPFLPTLWNIPEYVCSV